MLVVLQTKSRHGRAQRIQLRAHQMAKFGRSEWADYPFTNDRAMSDMHFEVRCLADSCQLANLDEAAETKVNGETIKGRVTIFDGDEIQAGTTVLGVMIEGGQVPPKPEEPEVAEPAPASAPPAVAAPVAVATTLAGTCAALELSAEVQGLAEEKNDADALIEALAADEQFMDAFRIRAYLLPKRDAVWWGCISVKEDIDGALEPDQLEALDVALEWVTDPSEEQRRRAEQASNDVSNQGPGGMLALSAFWSEGSIGPEGAPDVPADDRLVCQGVAAALLTAAYLGDASLANARMRSFLDRGKLVAAGELPVPTS